MNTNGTVAKYRIEVRIKYELVQIDIDEVISSGSAMGFAQYDVGASEINNEETRKNMIKIATKNALNIMISRIQSKTLEQMVIKEHQLESILKNNEKFLNFLIYGPNDGLISDQISKILNVFVEKLEFEKINITDKELDKDPELLDEIVRTVSMFSKGKVIIIESLKEKQLHIIESAINEEPTKTVLILKSQNLIKSSKLENYMKLKINTIHFLVMRTIQGHL